MIAQGNLPTDQALASLPRGPLDARVVAVRNDDGRWIVRHWVAHALPTLDRPPALLHDYGNALFVTAVIEADELVRWLTARDPVDVEGRAIEFQLMHQIASCRRDGSYSTWDPVPIPWPTRRYEFSTPDTQWNKPWGFMVSRDASPSLVDFDAAAFHYLYNVAERKGQAQLPTTYGLIRLADERGRIVRVRPRPASLSVSVAGTEVEAGRLELTSSALKASQWIGSRRTRTFRLPQGLPDEMLVLLSKSGECLDYRWLGRRYDLTPDVEEPPPDIPTLVRAEIQMGEGLTIEYKRKVPETSGEKYNVLKTVAAFAGQAGGTVIFGVGEKGEHEEGEVVGLASVRGVREKLHDMIRSQISPEPGIDVQYVKLDSQKVVALFVRPSGRAHALERDGSRFFVRRGSTTFPATHAEVRNLFHRETAQSGGLGRRFGRFMDS